MGSEQGTYPRDHLRCIADGGPDSVDRILGGAGSDSAADDEKDSYDSVETLLS